MQRFWTKIALVIVILLAAFWAAMPPDKKLRLGKDLRGGVTLVYSVEVRPGENEREVLASVIDVLKERVDPNGMFEISMVPQGRDRIEITMPLPGADVKAKRAEFDAMLASIESERLPPERIDRVMSLPSDERDPAIAELSGGDPAKVASLTELARAADEAAVRRQAFIDAEQRGDSDETLQRFAIDAADAEIAYEEAREAVGARSLTAQELRRALRLSDETKRLINQETGERAELPSPRALALERLRTEYPEQVTRIDDAVSMNADYESIRTTLDDPADLERMLRASGVLSFRITVDTGALPNETELRAEFQENGPRAARSPEAAWFKINKLENWFDTVEELRFLERDPAGYFQQQREHVVEEYDGEYWMLCWDIRGSKLTPESDRNWKVARAFASTDDFGRPAIGFNMDPRGASLLGKLTEGHVQDSMAVLLDDEVYTTANLLSRISRTGQISGDFSASELEYIIRVLNAGSLQNKLSPAPISRNAIGPELGLDYLKQGLSAGIIALISVSLFMVIYYFRCGLIAVVALACNGLLLLGVMSFLSATFTLPGIAGIILTFGMAVDSNVLIFERIREELRGGKDTKPAVRLGFSKAMSSIVDGNVTNLIVCIVLANVGTQEIKGFAITLGVGVLTTMFSALVVSRLVFDVLLELRLLRKIRMLPSAAPAIERAFEPGINWLGLRGLFIVVSSIYIGVGVYMIFVQRGEMMDTEFRGGTQVTLQFKLDESTDDPDDRVTMTRKEVEDKVIEITSDLEPDHPLADLRSAQVLPLDPDSSGVRSDKFMIKSVVTSEQEVIAALSAAFMDQLDNRPPLTFLGQREDDLITAPVYPLTNPRGILGPDIGRPRVVDEVSDFTGGVAIVLADLSPTPTKSSLEARFERMRNQQDFSNTAGRLSEVRVIEGSDDAVTAAVLLVKDESIDYVQNQGVWEEQLAAREWDLVRAALSTAATLASVQSFDAEMAGTFRAKAVVSVFLSLMLILIYVWVRFGSVRYSLAAIACLLHDCLTCIGLIALAEIVYKIPAAQSAVAMMGIQPFKIDLNMIAALLTIIGYSLNDTIIVMDRIRELRGRLPYATDKIINRSINMTISRTVITSGTTLLAILILYVFGGEGVRGFAYAMLIGVGVGTYSSIAVAAPLVWQRGHTEGEDEDGESPSQEQTLTTTTP